MMIHQISRAEYDEDLGTFRIWLTTGEVFYIENPGHAARLRKKVSAGGRISATQYQWLEKYREHEIKPDIAALREKIAVLRKELQEKR